jgi:serine/threonine-protein kinase HipA
MISPHIRAEKEPEKGAVTRFLENLLPEGEGLRSLAQMLKTSPSNLYSLLSGIGAETTGALTMTTGEGVPETKFRPIGRAELIERIAQRRERPLINWDGKPRLSLAGVQEKLPIVDRDGEFGLGEGKIASTHILKFGNARARHLVINEFFCMKLAQAIGLSVASCELLDLGERVLKVRRFDRAWQGQDHVKRLHVVDGCQALDLPPLYKYERPFGDHAHVSELRSPASLANIYAFCLQTDVPAKAQLEILRWVAFNLLIGNSDSHMKNISFFVTDEGMRLAPFYDLLSVVIYPDFNPSLAFHIGDTFVLGDVNAYHLAEMAGELNLKKSFVAKQFKKVIESVSKALETLELERLTADEAKFTAELKAGITARAHRLLIEVANLSKFSSI